MVAGRIAFVAGLFGGSSRRVLSYPHACEEGFRDTKSTRYGLDLADESRIQAERRANLLLIAALVTFALWLVGVSLKGSATERHIWVNTGTKRAPYSVIFLARIACRYARFELPADYLELAQAMLKGYFDRLEVG